jgi:hypothetical protein
MVCSTQQWQLQCVAGDGGVRGRIEKKKKRKENKCCVKGDEGSAGSLPLHGPMS